MSFIFFLGKAQKIATAIYLITGLWSEREPVREELRKKALILLSDIRTLSDNPTGNVQTITDIRRLLEHMLSLCDVAARSGMMSPMNRDFLSAQVDSFVSDLSGAFQEKGGVSSVGLFIKDVDIGKSSQALLLSSGRPGYKGHLKRHDKGQSSDVTKKDTRPVFGQFKQMTGPIKDIGAKEAVGGTDRKEKIYRIIEEKGSLTIKDIAQVAPEYSEKTIQRDLVDMVGSGKVKKKGERRWTVYFV